jgi:hypothetical protein
MVVCRPCTDILAHQTNLAAYLAPHKGTWAGDRTCLKRQQECLPHHSQWPRITLNFPHLRNPPATAAYVLALPFCLSHDSKTVDSKHRGYLTSPTLILGTTRTELNARWPPSPPDSPIASAYNQKVHTNLHAAPWIALRLLLYTMWYTYLTPYWNYLAMPPPEIRTPAQQQPCWTRQFASPPTSTCRD